MEVIRSLCPSIKSAAKVATNRKICLTFPMFIAIGISNGFIFASYTKASQLNSQSECYYISHSL